MGLAGDKKIVVFHILDILTRYTDEQHPMNYPAIMEKLSSIYEERPDIKAEEKATLDTVEPAEKVIEEKTPEITENKDNPKNSVSEQDVNSSKTDGSDDKKQVAASPETTENKNAPVSENTKENNNAVENSEDAISRLERELSEQLDGE